jgi:hypothetical protein
MKITEIDEALIRYADLMSAADISFKIGGILNPQQVLARIAVLCDAPDYLTAVQQDQLVTQKMRIIIGELMDRPRTDRNAEVLINALEKLGARLDKRQKATEEDLSQLYAFQGSVLVNAMEQYDKYMQAALGIDALTWNAHKEAALRHAQREIMSHEASGPEEIVYTEAMLES